MSTVRLTIRDEILKAGEDYARQTGTSLDALVENLLAKQVATVANPALAKTFEIAAASKGGARVGKWKREESYER